MRLGHHVIAVVFIENDGFVYSFIFVKIKSSFRLQSTVKHVLLRVEKHSIPPEEI